VLAETSGRGSCCGRGLARLPAVPTSRRFRLIVVSEETAARHALIESTASARWSLGAWWCVSRGEWQPALPANGGSRREQHSSSASAHQPRPTWVGHASEPLAAALTVSDAGRYPCRGPSQWTVVRVWNSRASGAVRCTRL